jgi:ABC-type antimicrobial peptide transport system permease subunit
MFFIYIWRELRRRHRQALLTALGLAVGVGLVVAVTAYASGVSKAQDQVLHSLYGVGTDISVTQTARLQNGGGPLRFGMNPGTQKRQGEAFARDQLRGSPGQQAIAAAKVATISKLRDVSAATGSLVLTDTHVSGKFARAFSNGGSGQSFGGGSTSGGSQPQPSASQAPIQVSSFSVAGVDVADAGLGPLSSTQVVSGRSFAAADAQGKAALVDKAYAKQKDLAVGDTIKVSGKTFAIVGIVTGSNGTSSTNVFIPLYWAQKLSGDTGQVNQVYVRATGAGKIQQVKKEIKAAMPKATVTTSADLAKQVTGSLSSASTLADRLGKWLAVAALVAAFLVACLLTVSAVTRRVREFGTLKALGWRSPRIVGQVLGESAVIGVVGGLIGVAIGVLGARLIAWSTPSLKATLSSGLGSSGGGASTAGGPPGGGGFGRAIGSAVQSVTVHLTAPVSLRLVALAVALALAGGLLAGALGGWRAARLRPADALRRLD